MGHETTKLTKIDKNINIGPKAINKLNKIISSNNENYNEFEKRGIYELTCNNCNKPSSRG
jgi:hypothetical protein